MVFKLSGCGILHGKKKISRLRVFRDITGNSPDILDALLLAAHVEIFESFAECTYVHIKDFRLDAGVVVAEQESILDCIHTADITAIRVASAIPRAGTDTLNKPDCLRSLAVARTNEMPLSRATSADQSFEFHARNYVLMTGVAVFIVFGRVVHIHTGGGDDDSDLDIHQLILVVVIDAVLITNIGAFATGDRVVTEAIIHIENICRRHSLRKWQIDRLA